VIQSRSSRRLLQFTVAACIAITPAAALTLQAQAAPPAPTVRTSAPASGHSYTSGRYIVTFADEPVASYTGYVKGFPATHPGRGQKLNPSSSAVTRWRDHLTARHDTALSRVGATKIYDYTVTNNAIAADLSALQATELSKLSGVVALTKDTLEHPDTTASPHFLGLDAPGGIWSQLGGGPHAGAGLVVGVIDTGIWPENPSFAGNTGIPVPATWHGTCVAGQNFPVTECNDKLVGARYYVSGFGKHNIAKVDYLSPRDGAGHGSHTSSTAAGDFGVPITIDGNNLGTASGMAPGAKLAMYKACWDGKAPNPDGCFSSDSVAAINDAVLDGVDVLNYSIGGTSESSVLDPVSMAFRGAANANVFVANSAGNSGPGASTLDHPAPWVTTVAAATFRRAFQAVELGNGARYVGASTTGPLTTAAPIATAVTVKLASATDHDAALCFAGSLDPAKATGKVVVCDRGVIARIDKGFEVKRAGGVGIVLANTSPNSINGDYHPVPAVHVTDTDGAAIKAYIAGTAAPTAKIVPLTAAELEAAPQVPEITDFSSRGPSTTTGGDILKPDIAAPGNDVVAATAPPFAHGRLWDFMSGTSMSSPHIAGIGALVKARHPSWLPSEIKSAIMTSAGDTVSSANDPFAQGAGFVNPNGAADPGLVYPTTPTEWRQYLVSQGVHFAPPNDTLTPISGPNLNQASIAIGALPGVATVPRHVRNVGSTTATYTASASVPGFTMTVTPASLTLQPGESGSFTVTFTRSTADFDTWAKGSLTWSDGTHHVRAPIAVRPVPVAAPAEVHGDASASGSKDYSVTPGFTGSLANTVSGLVGVTPLADSVVTGPFDALNPVAGAGTKVYHVTVPAGTRAARFSLDSDDDTADLDLYAYLDGDLVDLSASGSADEQVTLVDPAEGTYDVYVNGFTTPGGTTSYHLANFVVPAAPAGNASVTPNPASVTQGTPTTLTAAWSGLDAAKRWFGVINYTGTTSYTLLSVG
jgi:subtilisin family serine protease